MSFLELRGEQQRQLIDTIEVFGAWRDADTERRRRFPGSMRWVERGGNRYLLRKIGSRERSLGPSSEATREAYDRFLAGREENRDRLAGLAGRLDQMAPVNRAMGIGRVPVTAARILRDLDLRELLGHQLFVVGTVALFAYEARAGVRISPGLLATGDVDLLLDHRQSLSLVGREVKATGLLGILQRLDHSFSAVRKRGFRAVNRDGYFVDLIRPEERDPMRDRSADSLSDLAEDLHGSPIHGLGWLVNAPRFHAVAIGEDGYPVPLECLDPRVFALHKAWISGDGARDPRKRSRDLEQARACADIASSRLGLSFSDETALTVLPASIRALADTVVPKAGDPRAGGQKTTPGW